MIQLAAIAFLLVTLPVWGGAMAALVAGGITLAFNNPLLLVAIFIAPFVLAKFV